MAQVHEILARKGSRVTTIGPQQSVMDAVRAMNECRIGAVVVTENDTVIGIFSERDLLNRVVMNRKDLDKTKISQVMSSPVAYCTPETDLDECRAAFTQKKIRHLPVVEGGKLVGLISIGDLIAWKIADHETTIQYLKEYIYGRS